MCVCVYTGTWAPAHTHVSNQLCWLLPQTEGVMSGSSQLGGGGCQGDRVVWVGRVRFRARPG